MGERIEPIYAEIGTWIAHWRCVSNMTQADLSRELGVTRSHVANMESGRTRIHIHTVFALCQILNVEPSQIVPYKGRRLNSLQTGELGGRRRDYLMSPPKSRGRSSNLPKAIKEILQQATDPASADDADVLLELANRDG